MAKVAKEKVWRTHKNVLVADGHDDAAQLIARKGQLIEETDLRHYGNADEFFVDHDTKEGEAAQRHVETKPAPWTKASMEEYRQARQGDEPTSTTLERLSKTKDKEPAPAEKVRKSRPGPEKASPKKAASLKR